MDRGWLPAVTSAAALSVYGFAGEGGSPGVGCWYAENGWWVE
jgi:hypothetical protein